jgi:predicted transcriptional regulator of viral defense system
MSQIYISISEKIINIAREQGMVRPHDLAAHGIHRMYLQRLYERGELVRLGRGIYTLADADHSQYMSLAEVCKRVPAGVICLLSALRFHEIGTQNPHQVWMAIDPKKHLPKIEYPSLRIVRYSNLVLSEGVEEHETSDGTIRVYGIAKTVADCFRYRNKIGLDVVLEALRECRRERRVTLDELWHFASVDKVSTVMRPYLEAIT